jgi:hypothetical protein
MFFVKNEVTESHIPPPSSYRRQLNRFDVWFIGKDDVRPMDVSITVKALAL